MATYNRENCKACGNDNQWCSVYTSCPLNRGGAHDMKRVCITTKKGRRPLKHVFVFSGNGDERHCTYCGDLEGENGSKSLA
jgi:hypothetical protein